MMVAAIVAPGRFGAERKRRQRDGTGKQRRHAIP
jgi:hypothetical protein